jgi:hypothetical protein
MCHTISHSFQTNGPEEENDKDDIRVECCDVDDKRVFSDAFDDAQVHKAPEKNIFENLLVYYLADVTQVLTQNKDVFLV